MKVKDLRRLLEFFDENVEVKMSIPEKDIITDVKCITIKNLSLCISNHGDGFKARGRED